MKTTANVTLNIAIFGGPTFDEKLEIPWWDVEWFPPSVTEDDANLRMHVIEKHYRAYRILGNKTPI